MRKGWAAPMLAAALAGAGPAEAVPVTFTLGIGVTRSVEAFDDGRIGPGPHAVGSIAMFQFTADTDTPDLDVGSDHYALYQDAVTAFRLGNGSWLTAAPTGSYKTHALIVRDSTGSSAGGYARTCAGDCSGSWVWSFGFSLSFLDDHLDGASMLALGTLDPLSAYASDFRFFEARMRGRDEPAPVELGNLMYRELGGRIVSMSVQPAATVPEGPTVLLMAAGLGALVFSRRTRRHARRTDS